MSPSLICYISHGLVENMTCNSILPEKYALLKYKVSKEK